MAYTYRYCPQCAHPLEDRLVFGRLRQACPRCDFIHFRDPKVGAAVLIEGKGRILLLLRPPDDVFGPDTWGLPAGLVEHDESPQDAAIREAEEETGLQVETGELFGVYFYADDPRGNGVLIVYRATIVGGHLQPLLEEVAGVQWFPFSTLPENLSEGGHGQAIRQWAAVQHDLNLRTSKQ